MKKTSMIFLLLAIPALVFAQQPETVPTVLRDKKGVIQAMEFSESDGSKGITDKEFLRDYLKVSADDGFVKANDKRRSAEFTDDHFDQFYKSVKVEGAGYNFHYKNGKIFYAHGHYVKIDNLDVVPSLTPEKAKSQFAAHKNIPESDISKFTTELLIRQIASRDSASYLVYKVLLYANNSANNEVGIVDAKTGAVLDTEPLFLHAASHSDRVTNGPVSKPAVSSGKSLLPPATGTFATRYSGNRTAATFNDLPTFRLLDETRASVIHTWNMQGGYDFSLRAELTDNDNTWTAAEHSPTENDMALDVHWVLQQIFDRMNTFHSVNSFNDPAVGAGFPIDAHIRYGNTVNDQDNAGWSPTANLLMFGDGAVTFRPVASVDAVAHEYGHGMTDFQIGWSGTGDQGAFNEGLSDIWGAIMQHRITGGNIWQIGEQIMVSNPCLRDLQNTNSLNVRQPMADTYGTTQYNSASNVYVRSGVLSHWAYLLANGGSGTNGMGGTYNVYGIGMDQLENLIVRAVFGNFLDNTTTYAQVRTGMINAARAQCGNQNGVLVRQVINAWAAVNVGAVGTDWQPIVAGPDIICPNATYTVTNLPEGASITWSTTSASAATITSGGVATRNGSYNGPVTIRAVIADECGTIVITKAVNVGKPVISFKVDGQPFTNGQICSGHLAFIDVVGHDPANSYSWSLQSGSSGSLSGSGPSASFQNYSIACSAISVTASNSCGTTNTGLTICTRECSGMAFKVFPNPASDFVTVQVEHPESLDAMPEELVLYSEKSGGAVRSVSVREVFEKKAFKDGNKIEINVKDLPRGTYYLHVIPGKASSQKTERIRILLK
jgi:bacillolysin